MIIDTHAHYDDEAFNEDRDALLTSFAENDIEMVVNVGASLKTSENTIKLTKQYPFVYGAIGVHPSETAELNEENFKFLEENIKDEKIVAVGEIGLDYYWDTPEREIQTKWFKRQLSLAIKEDMPVIIHSRDAANDTLVIMKEAKKEAEMAGKKLRGVIHCFSYTKEMAREYVKMGFYLGIGGVLTFKNARVLKEVVEDIPIEHLVLETDCPYLSPEPNRGKRNSSLNLPYIINAIADSKNLTYAEVVSITNQNAKRLYQLEK
ncbi:MAG: TatD family deoxyribonuclease [Lachnospiraceae bacterium]|nr:TatD family deoxyribonuclease [Lachnospiraceae bacterium]